MLERSESKVGAFFVSCCWKSIIDGFEWVGTGLYGPSRNELRSELWEELQGVRQQWPHPWSVFGNFNVVRFPSERRGCNRVSPSML